jgi:hypothetical protein
MTESVGNNENLNDFGRYHSHVNAFPVVSFVIFISINLSLDKL